MSAATHLSHPILVQHVAEFVVLLLTFHFVKILDCVPRGTQLNQDNTGFFDCDVPVILQVEYLLPDRKRDELAIFLKELQIFRDLNFAEVIAQAAEAAKYIETTSL
jgi:hypothetical protein